jgi:LCP family protein required for cell wall assembly
MPAPSDPPPEYTKYRAGPRFLRRGSRGGESLLDDLRRGDGGAGAAPPAGPDAAPGSGDVRRDYGRRAPRLPGLPGRRRRGPQLPRGPISVGRVVKWIVLAVVGWLALSLVLFLISAQIQQGDLSGKVDLGGAGFPLTSANNVLVLGSDQRPKGSKEPGASTSGPSRSDSIMLMRVGGGKNARLSIPRDTIVDIPGHGRNKINAAYAIGGPSLAIKTIESYLGIKINHLVEVNFENFPQLIDSLGGITYKGGCVVSEINGGSRNGGYTLRLKAGEHEIDGKQALALARTRKNNCAKREDDRTRARRQQKILGAIKDKVISFETFIRLPWVSWAAPRAVQSDMAGPSLLGLVGAELIGGAQKARVLKASGGITLPDGGAGLVVDESEKRTAVQNFLAG